MAGCLPFIASFVPRPVFAFGHRVGLITVPCTGLPIPLGTNLWHVTCSAPRARLVVHARTRLMCWICLRLYVPTHVCIKCDCRADLFPFSSCGFLSEGTWYPDPPLRFLLKQLSAHSIAHRLHERPFILCSALFFNQHSSFTCLSGQIASFVFVPSQASKPAPVFFKRNTQKTKTIFSYFLLPAGFHHALKSVSETQKGRRV